MGFLLLEESQTTFLFQVSESPILLSWYSRYICPTPPFAESFLHAILLAVGLSFLEVEVEKGMLCDFTNSLCERKDVKYASKQTHREFLAVQWLGLCTFTA